MATDSSIEDSASDAAFVPFQETIAAHALATPDGIAFREGDRTMSWQVLQERIAEVAGALSSEGMAAGDHVAVLGHPSLAYAECLFGIVAARACVVPLPVSASIDTLLAMLQDCAAKMLFVDPDAGEAIDGMATELSTRGAVRIVRFGRNGEAGGDYPEWRSRGSGRPLPRFGPLRSQPGDPFNIIYSSGTTGMPKGIVHLHGTRQRQAGRPGLGFGPQTRTLLSTPMYSNTTIIPMLGTLAGGGETILMRKFDAAHFLAIASKRRVTHSMLVPVQYKRILAHEDFDGSDLSSLELSQSTGAPMSVALKREIVERWPGRFLELYGMTEGGVGCFLEARLHPDKLGTVGTPGYGTDTFLIDGSGRRMPLPLPSRANASTALPNDGIGEVVGRSPFMMAGYHNRPEANAEIRWYDDEGRVHHRTGDIGRFDEDGFLTLLDRSKDVIISGGNNIYAADLEAVLARHGDVQDAAVIGVPSEAWGESPLALVVLKAACGTSAEALLEWVNGQVGKTQRLVAVEVREQLERSHLGKLSKKELRAPYWLKT